MLDSIYHILNKKKKDKTQHNPQIRNKKKLSLNINVKNIKNRVFFI